MDKAAKPFDWIGWYASIPGIPADWGQGSRVLALRPERPGAQRDAAEPLPKAA